MSDIDPIEFGALRAEVRSLRKEFDEMSADIKQLLAMVERSKGALWVGLSLASLGGAVVSWVAGRLIGH